MMNHVNNLNNLNISYNDLTDVKLRHRSGIGIFKSAIWKQSHVSLTVALILLEDIPELQNINHENIMKIYGITYDSECNKNMLTLQFATNGSLGDCLTRGHDKFNRKTKLKIAKDIAKGLKYLHENNIIHGDLHPNNIFIENEGALIANPLISKINKRYSSINTTRNMLFYLDPRSFKDPSCPPDYNSDIYSFGVIMWQIFSCKEPFPNHTNLMNFMYDILNDKREEPMGDAPDEYINLYRRCWSSDLNNRPSMQEVVSSLMQIS
ncbi:11492_t:CDS:2 [Dentiscutata erythropus]|uniref:11492_t:CDS:1 n=1 Tax=Dentiscutata erythropus TaxID=1348616 RepID=A0A9N9AME4_9GLOM|nr:11492_t:CDS:2 [Dentiscutata erythropus]